MSVPAPHFLLHARANRSGRSGRWCFSLESRDGAHSLKIEDAEPATSGERLELLALVRGLEALPQPAHVTVVAPSRYVNRMLNGGLEEWRANDWRWENHGEMVPVKNADLWRRVDRALHFHKVRLGSPNSPPEPQVGAAKSMPSLRETAPAVPSATGSRDGAHRLAHTTVESRLLARRTVRRRKSLARKMLATSMVLRRRFQQRIRRWSQAIERLSAEDDSYAWAD